MKQFRDYPYLVSELGEVFRKGSKRALKLEHCNTGYKRVSLCVGGKVERFLVHRIVGELYCPNPENKPDINHIDNERSNNHYMNLEWCSHSENMRHCHKQDRCSNIVASNAAKDKNLANTISKLEKSMGDRFLGLVKLKRWHTKYICLGCANKYSHRTDSPSIKRGGICRACFISKDEDIV